MAGLKSQADVDEYLAYPDLWVPITETLLKKGMLVWDGVSKTIYQVTERKTHPDMGPSYILRNINTGENVFKSMPNVHEKYRKYQAGKDLQLVKAASVAPSYRINLIAQGSVFPMNLPTFADVAAAKEEANAQREMSGQVYVVINTATGETVHRADAPLGTTARTRPIGETITELKNRATVKLTADMLFPGVIVKHPRQDVFYEFVKRMDDGRLVFRDIQTGNEEMPMPRAIATTHYLAVVPYPSDFADLIPRYPRDAYAAIVKTYGEQYGGATSPPTTSEPTPTVPIIPTRVDVSKDSPRAVGAAAAERAASSGKGTPPVGNERYAVEWFQRNWNSPKYYEKRYKSEYHATERADRLMKEPGVAWTSVVDTTTNKRVVVFPDGFDPDAARAPQQDSEYVVRLLHTDGTTADFKTTYRGKDAAEKRARKLIAAAGVNIRRAEVIEMPAGRLVHVLENADVDVSTVGGIPLEKVGDVVKVSTTVTAAADGTIKPTLPQPPLAPVDPTERFAGVKAIIATKPPRETVREDLAYTTARKLVSLTCVSVISRYDVSIKDAAIICQENASQLDLLANQLARNEIDIYAVIKAIEETIVASYELTDLRTVVTQLPVIEGVGGAAAEDIGPAIAQAVKAELANTTTQRALLIGHKTGTIQRGEFEEAVYMAMTGKLKRPRSRADVTLMFLSMGTATPERVWDDYEIIVIQHPKEGMIAEFNLITTTQGNVLKPSQGKTYPGKGFLQLVDRMRKRYGADIIVDTDRDRVDDDQLL
jgi:hypothetical protein